MDGGEGGARWGAAWRDREIDVLTWSGIEAMDFIFWNGDFDFD